MEYYQVPILFNPGDIVYDINNKHCKRYIIKFDEKKGQYLCDGSVINIIDSFKFKKVKSSNDLFVGDHCRIKNDPNCYSIYEFLDNEKVKIFQIHGDNYFKIVNLKDLLDTTGHKYLNI